MIIIMSVCINVTKFTKKLQPPPANFDQILHLITRYSPVLIGRMNGWLNGWMDGWVDE